MGQCLEAWSSTRNPTRSLTEVPHVESRPRPRRDITLMAEARTIGDDGGDATLVVVPEPTRSGDVVLSHRCTLFGQW